MAAQAPYGGTLNVLNVAEKNDAAKEISRVLSSGRSNRVRPIWLSTGLIPSSDMYNDSEADLG